MIYPIFLSHSSHDKELVEVIKEEIEKELGANSVFVSERIGSGEIWFSKVHENLKQCKIMIILLTKPASDSLWVGFEAGFVWDRLQSQEKIHILRHPNVKALPNPIDTIHAKYVTDSTHLQELFQKLCEQFGKKEFESKANIYRITSLSQSVIPLSPERSLAKFDEYLNNRDNWIQIWDNLVESWICEKDVLYHFQIDHNEYKENFNESWTKNLILLDPLIKHFEVRLKISNITIKILNFVTLDGGRLTIPMPEIRYGSSQNDKSIFYWSRKSFAFKVGKIIEFFDMTPMYINLEDVAYKAGIEIID